ncbi:hypothetical protein [Actinoplanes sp. NPDC048796]|uniref:hypothetical protein n=1 Tax=Actinoplanes sp. NPDC048796 TaxID=3155640 RepID=UPI0033E33AF6
MAMKLSPGGGRGGHGQQVQGGDVADVDIAGGELQQGRGRAVEHARDGVERGGVVRAEDRAEYGGRVDRGQFEAAALAGHEIPGRAFGQGLRPLV